MNKSLLIIIGILIIVGIGFFVFKNQPTTPPSPSTTETAPSAGTTQMAETANERYMPYDPTVIAAAADKKRVLFFYANWCPTCKPVNTELETNAASIPADVVIIRVNYNDTDTDQAEKDLARQYGITYQHTFVLVDSTGNEVKKWNGGGLVEIEKNIR